MRDEPASLTLRSWQVGYKLANEMHESIRGKMSIQEGVTLNTGVMKFRKASHHLKKNALDYFRNASGLGVNNLRYCHIYLMFHLYEFNAISRVD